MAESSRFLAVTLPVAAVLPCPEDATWVCCLNCSAPLDLHQPEADEPHRFVGTCDQCARWYLLDWDPLAGDGHMIMLPTREDLQAAVKSKGEPGEPGGAPEGGQPT
jgi:hypothetical protein